MLIKGNSKLGGEIYHFSLPSGSTCPGQTTDCASVCYAKNGYYNYDNVKDSLRDSLECANSDDFVERMVTAIGRRTISTVRIHVSGDFYSAEYIRKWVEIVRRCPTIKFYTYTRSWRCADLLPALLELAVLHNIELWWSTDRSTNEIDGAPPVVDRVHAAYMRMDDNDPVPDYADLVFRVQHKTVMYLVNHKPVCPYENGTAYTVSNRPTCSRCKVCYQRAEVNIEQPQNILVNAASYGEVHSSNNPEVSSDNREVTNENTN